MLPNKGNLNIDIVMCIDATASMTPHIERVKHHALDFYGDILQEYQKRGKHIDQLRTKVIVFRDYYVDTEPMIESAFFELPDRQGAFKAFVSNIKADGGGDEPENGLEALSLAILSPWNTAGENKRHILVIFTDASAHNLNKFPRPSIYPSTLPSNMEELTNLWMGKSARMEKESKRLILFSPDTYPWSEISTVWDNVVHHPAQAGSGLVSQDYQTIINAIVSTLRS